MCCTFFSSCLRGVSQQHGVKHLMDSDHDEKRPGCFSSWSGFHSGRGAIRHWSFVVLFPVFWRGFAANCESNRAFCATIEPLSLGNEQTCAIRSYHRFSSRITSFKPDQTSSTAHTFTSTSPSGNASARIVSSVISVGRFDAFFGQDTQRTPLGLSFFL